MPLILAPSLNHINKAEHWIYIHFLSIYLCVFSVHAKVVSTQRIRIYDFIQYLVLRNDIILYRTWRSRTPSPDTIYPLHVARLLCLIGWLLCRRLSGSKTCCRLAQTDVTRKSSFQQSSSAKPSSLLYEITLCCCSSVCVCVCLYACLCGCLI